MNQPNTIPVTFTPEPLPPCDRYPIERGYPIPIGKFTGDRQKLAVTMITMELGESFLWDGPRCARETLTRISRKLGIEITWRKEDGAGYRIWRIK